MKPQPTNTQAVVYNINNTNGNNYVNHVITATTQGPQWQSYLKGTRKVKITIARHRRNHFSVNTMSQGYLSWLTHLQTIERVWIK